MLRASAFSGPKTRKIGRSAPPAHLHRGEQQKIPVLEKICKSVTDSKFNNATGGCTVKSKCSLRKAKT